MKNDNIEKAILVAGGSLFFGMIAVTHTIRQRLKYDADGYDKKGFNRNGFDREGYNKDGFDQNGFDRNGFDCTGYDQDGYNQNGFDRNGFDCTGYDQDGYNQNGFDRNGFDRNGFDQDGYDKNGYDQDGFNRKGFNRKGYDHEGYNKKGYNKNMFNRNGYDPSGHTKEWILKQIHTLELKLDKAQKAAKKGYVQEAASNFRNILEQYCLIIIQHYKGKNQDNNSLVEIINYWRYCNPINDKMLDKMHQIRKICNNIIHEAYDPSYNELHFCYCTLQELLNHFRSSFP